MGCLLITTFCSQRSCLSSSGVFFYASINLVMVHWHWSHPSFLYDWALSPGLRLLVLEWVLHSRGTKHNSQPSLVMTNWLTNDSWFKPNQGFFLRDYGQQATVGNVGRKMSGNNTERINTQEETENPLWCQGIVSIFTCVILGTFEF